MEVGQNFLMGKTELKIVEIDDNTITCEYVNEKDTVAFDNSIPHYIHVGRAYVARLTMKVTKVVPDEGCICGECGKFVSINEGCSETFLDGHIEFGCPYCYKTTLYDLPLNEVLE